MASTGIRRLVLLAVSALTLLLAACGSSSIYEPFVPARVVVFGDGMADLGQRSNTVNSVTYAVRYTVNDGSSQSNWTERVAAAYGRSITASSASGTSYAIGNARVQDADALPTNSPSVKAQIDAFFAAGGLQTGDLIIVNAGTADVIAQASAAITDDAMVTALRQAGSALAAQLQRLVDAGAKHLLVVGTYSLDRSPWAVSTGRTARLLAASTAFNDRLKLDMQNAGLGSSVFYVDLDTYLRSVTGNNVTAPACNSVVALTDLTTIGDVAYFDGTNTLRISSAACTVDTVGGVGYGSYMFADPVYLTPSIQRGFGDYAAGRLRTRW